MSTINHPSRGTSDWIGHLARKGAHWHRKKSAFETSVAWELAAVTKGSGGLPPKIHEALNEHDALRGAQLLLAIPEHKVALDGQGFASATDVWALLRTRGGLISMAAEGKAGESFGPLVKNWLPEGIAEKPTNREIRLQALKKLLGLTQAAVEDLRYQLFHRTASALLEAKRFGAGHAVVLVQSFNESPTEWKDFANFAAQLNIKAEMGHLASRPTNEEITLWLGWVQCEPATDAQIARLVALGKHTPAPSPN